MTSPNLTHIHDSLRHLAVAVADLTPDPKNARKHDRRNLDAIKASLEQFGFRQPIVVQQQGMIVRAGNGRLEVSKELGWSHVPAIVVDEAEAEAIAFAIADNRTAELAEWDFENLAAVLDELQTGGLDLSDIGWEDYEVEPLLTATFEPPPIIGDGSATDTQGIDRLPTHVRTLVFSPEQFKVLKSWAGDDDLATSLVSLVEAQAE